MLTSRWNTVYPLYFDAKVSATDGRRVPRKESVWWPQAAQIAHACRVIGLPCVLEVSYKPRLLWCTRLIPSLTGVIQLIGRTQAESKSSSRAKADLSTPL